MQHKQSSELGVTAQISNIRKGIFGVSGEQLAFSLLGYWGLVCIIDRNGSGELEDSLFIIFIQHKNNSSGVEILGYIIFWFLNSPINIFEGLWVHT